ncbi:DHS-like NAD/FAD-binding domain-containing protein, partial [Xylona heveae TC161]
MPITDVLDSDGSNLQTIADTLAKAKKVVIVTGAGISTNSGIPDFRSENGLYSLIQAQSRSQSRMSGRDMFDARIWQDSLSTEVFYRFIASFRKTVRDDIARTTATHRFIKTMRDGGRLVRCYTQNIDGLEGRDGLNTDLASGKGNKARFSRKAMQKPRPDGPIFPGSDMYGGCEVVQLHGDLELLRCSICQTSREWGSADEELMLLHGESPPCETCLGKDQDRRLRGKRGLPVGFLRPNVVLYGEEHPNADLLSPIITHDLASAPDVLLILGTSLQVHGLKVLVKEFAKAVHARGRGAGKVIFVNNTKPAESAWNGIIDYWVGMDCDTWVTDMRKRRSDIWLRQGELKLPGTAVNKAGGPRTQLERAKE